MNALSGKNLCHKCEWETRTITEKKIDYTILIIILLKLYYMYVCVLMQLTLQSLHDS